MSALLTINVNDHVEKKNGLSYLSWAWAWAEALKIDPQATWSAHEWNAMPAMFLPDGSAMVKVSVTIKGDTKACVLPVMDHRNKAIKNPDAFAINTATMRCLAKAISMHGLGLYIYAGEDLPEGEEPQKKPNLPSDLRINARKLAWDALGPEQQAKLHELAVQVEDLVTQGNVAGALDQIDWTCGGENEERAGLAYLLAASTNSALRKVSEARNSKKAA